MANIKIDTELVTAASNNIKLYNSQIRDNYSAVEKAVNQLDNNWDGEAATAAIGKFKELKSKFGEARYNVIDNYVNFLMKQVGEGYTQTENTNVSLADRFK